MKIERQKLNTCLGNASNKLWTIMSKSQTFCRTQSKNFQAKVWKVSLENTTTWNIKSLAFSLNLCAPSKHACSNYSVGNPLWIQHNRLSTQEWCNCEKCEKMPTSLECMRSHEIPAFKAFHLNFKTRLSWNTAALELFAVEFSCEGNIS